MVAKRDPLDPKALEAQRLRGLGWTIKKIGQYLKMSHGWVCTVCKIGQLNNRRGESGDVSFVEFDIDRPIKTLEDACAAASVDLKVWYVESWECSAWTVGMNVKEGKTSKAVQTQQYRVKMRLRRIMKRAIQEAIDLVFKRMKQHSPKYQTPKIRQSGPETLAVVCLFDTHFGKLAWGLETNNDYDLKIAENVFRNAVIDMMSRVKDRKIAKFCLPLGNDFYHIDNKRNTTFMGTPQDTDSRYAKIFQVGKLAVIWAIEQMIRYAKVDVVWVPGNHDPTTSYHLAETVDSWFHRSKDVVVDASPPQRKYYPWNDTLLGFTHGDKIKHENLPNLMAQERPMEWAGTTCREWLVGHNHRTQKWVSKDTDTYQGTTVRTIQALTATDAWHFENGFIGARRAAEILFYEKNFGYSGNLIAQARET